MSRTILWIMSAACGASAANIFYNQPLLGNFAKEFGASPAAAGMVATAAQVGYGVGLLFFVPLGDIVERRRVLLFLTVACTACLIGAALAPNLQTLIALQLLIGITAMG